MKNKFLLAILLLAFTFNLIAQNSNKQYSVKATALLENKLDLPSSPYQITMKTLGDESNKRFSAGVNVSSNYSETSSSALNLNVRFGKERFMDFGKEQKWRFFYGLDYLAAGRVNLSGSNSVGTVSVGLAPLAGLQYRINERLVVYTETSYELSVASFVSNRQNFRARLNNRLVPVGSIWLGFELFKVKKKS